MIVNYVKVIKPSENIIYVTRDTYIIPSMLNFLSIKQLENLNNEEYKYCSDCVTSTAD